MEELFKQLSLGGEIWILYCLIFLSALTLAISVERKIYFYRNRENIVPLMNTLIEKLEKNDYESAISIVEMRNTPAKRVFYEGLAGIHRGIPAVQELFSSREMAEKMSMERFVTILGTIGNNAPFVGLLGTVLGIIKAFNDLSLLSSQGPSAVMAGISEALIATAVGLVVAIPSVIAYNYFQRKIKTECSQMERATKIILSFLMQSENEKMKTRFKLNPIWLSEKSLAPEYSHYDKGERNGP